MLLAIGLLWVGVFIGGSANSGYSQTRDYISALASHGATHPWLGMLAIASPGLACLLTAVYLRALSRTAGIAVVLAGIAFLAAAFFRITCVEGAARCGVGDRMDIDLHGAEAATHEVLVVLATLSLVVAMTAAGVARLRGGHRWLGIASLVAAVATVVTFVAQEGSSPGGMQRVWVLVMCAWVAGAAIYVLAREESGVATSATSPPSPARP